MFNDFKRTNESISDQHTTIDQQVKCNNGPISQLTAVNFQVQNAIADLQVNMEWWTQKSKYDNRLTNPHATMQLMKTVDL